VEELSDLWAVAILHECHILMRSQFALMGLSQGASWTHFVALAAKLRFRCPSLVILVDPMPVIHLEPPIRNKIQKLREAALNVMIFRGHTKFEAEGELFHIPMDATEADICILMAEGLAARGLVPFTLSTMVERLRELRVCEHLAELTQRYMGRFCAETLDHHDGRILLVLASGRKKFFASVIGGSCADPDEASSSATARGFGGEIAAELAMNGEHMQVCLSCTQGHVQSFNALLQSLLDECGGL